MTDRFTAPALGIALDSARRLAYPAGDAATGPDANMTPLFQVATAAHLAGSIVLALFFVLLARHDPRPYLNDWTAAWVAQVVALSALLFAAIGGWSEALSLFLVLEAVHGLLLVRAARDYAQGTPRRGWFIVALIALVAWAAVAPTIIQQRALVGAQFVVLAAAYFATAIILWPLREPAGMGLRLTTNVLVITGLFQLHLAAQFFRVNRSSPAMVIHLDISPFLLLLLQMLLALGMVLAVMEAAQWALAATNQQLQESQRRLKVLAETDPLTGCFNRHVFRDLVDDVREKSGGVAGALIMFDMDALKAMNDRHGHAAGDDALRRVAEAISERIRTTDILVRWGGDEFMVVLPGATLAEGEGRRAQVAAAIAAAGLSVSAGLAAYGPGIDIMDAVKQADAAMYRAKAERRSIGSEA